MTYGSAPRYSLFSGGAVDDTAARHPADPVHRVRAGRIVENSVDRARYRTLHHARAAFARRRHSRRANHQGPNAGRLHLARRAARGAAADPAAPAQRGAAVAGAGVAVPDRGGGDRRGKRPRLPHLSAAALSRDGHHTAVRAVDHRAGLRRRLSAARVVAPAVSVGKCRMSTLVVRNLRKEYGDQVILERVNLTVTGPEFCTIVGASGCGKSTFLRMLLGQDTASRGELLLDGKPLPSDPGPDRGIVFQRYSVFPHLTVLGNVLLGLELAALLLLGRLFGAARRRASAEAEAALHAVGLFEARQISRCTLRRHAATPFHRAVRGEAPIQSAIGRALRRARSRPPRRHA